MCLSSKLPESVDPMDRFSLTVGKSIRESTKDFKNSFLKKLPKSTLTGLIVGLVIYVSGFILIPFLSGRESKYGIRSQLLSSPLFYIILASFFFGIYLAFVQSIEINEFLRYFVVLLLGIMQIMIPFMRIWQLRYFYETATDSYVFYDSPKVLPEGWDPIVNPLIRFIGTPDYFTRVEGYQPFINLGAYMIVLSGIMTVVLATYFIFKERKSELVNFADEFGSLSDAQLTFSVNWKIWGVLTGAASILIALGLFFSGDEFFILIGTATLIGGAYFFKLAGYSIGEKKEDRAMILPLFGDIGLTVYDKKRTHSLNRLFQFGGYLGILGVIFVFLGLEGIVGMRTFLSQPGYIYTLAFSMHIVYLTLDPSFRFRLAQSKLAYGFVMPTVLMLIFELYIPILVALYLSFQNIRTQSYAYYSLSRRNLNVGFENYQFLINGDLIWIAVLFFVPLVLAKYAWKYADSFDSGLMRNVGKLLIVLSIISINVWVVGRIFVPNYEAFIDEKSSLFIDPSPVPVFRNTVIWTLASVISHLILGTTLALLMNTEFRGRGIARALMIIPWAVPNFITISIFGAFIFDNNSGAANMILNLLHLPTNLWMNSSNILTTAILVNIWLGYPFIMVSILAALQSIPNDVYEAAEIDGATRFTKFFKITLPLIKPTVFVISLLGFLWTFNLFNVIYLLTFDKASSLSVKDYYILVVYIFNTFNGGGNWSMAATLSFVLFLMVAGFSWIYAQFVGKGPYEL